ncbi:MAG: sulfatase [Candidatus Sumerlaeota bacterium]|nr:sulfatase [Candidatus Sumerlaeota bacterium]
MKAIFLLADTFRRDHIGAYGNPWIHTPNLDRLASMSNVFDSYYVGSFPTLPNRRDMALGMGDHGAAFNPWKGIGDDEVTLIERLARNKIHSMLITDVANTVTRGRNFFKGYSAYSVIRGQEGDPYWSDMDVPLEFPVDLSLIRYPAERWHQILINRARRRVEDDWFAPNTFKLACEWLERNRKRDDFVLWVETFDPHEPWDPPQWHIDRYDPGYQGRVFEAPTYGLYKEMGITDREMQHTHARYCGECSMVDTAVGRVLRKLEELRMLDDVALVFTTDHGAYFGLEGDNGLVCKPHVVGANGMVYSKGGGMIGPPRFFSLYTGTMRIPLFLKMPRQTKGKRIRPITQPWDITPTILDLFGMPAPKEFTGQSLLPLAEGKKTKPRPYAFNGASHGVRQAMNEEWIYTVYLGGEREPWLIDLKNNPKQDKNAAKKHPEVCKTMHAALAKFDAEVKAM